MSDAERAGWIAYTTHLAKTQNNVADVSFSIRAIDATRAAFVSVQRGLSQLSKEAGGFDKGLLKAGLAVVGVNEVMGSLKNTIRDVRENIEDIPALPDEFRESIYLFNDSLKQSEAVVKDFVAKSIVAFQNLGQEIGLFVGWAIYGDEAEEAARRQIAAQAEALREMGKMKRDGVDVAKLPEQLRAAELAAGKAMAKITGALLSPQEQVDALNAKLGTLYMKLADVDASTPQGMLERIKLYKELEGASESLVKSNQALNEELKRQGALAREVGGQMAASFENAVFSGENLRGMLKGIAQDLMRLVFQNLITKPLAGFISGGLMSFFGGGKAAGGSVSAGTPYMVGEKGPELFTPSQAGRIIPNHASGGGSSSGGGVTIQQTNNFSSGIQGVQLAQMLEQNRRATIAGIQRAKQDRKVRL